MSGSIPKPIAAYFEGNERLDVDAMLAPFAEDAVVSDENCTHRGRQAIRTWIEQATIGNRAVATPQSVTPAAPIRLWSRRSRAHSRAAQSSSPSGSRWPTAGSPG